MSRYLIAIVVVLAALSSPRPAAASEPGWVGQVVKPRSERAKIRQTPMIHRPYRPLHFYGNTVRRVYYHGRVLPAPSDLEASARAFAQGR